MINKFYLSLPTALLLLTGCQQAIRPDIPPAVQHTPFELAGHSFHRRTLANGLEAIAVQDKENSASVFMIVAAGKRQETDETTGLAHLTEHAMYTGTEDVEAGEHDRYIRELGGQSNAFTREDFTLYYDHDIPVDSLDAVLEMEADRLRNLNFPSEAIHFEREQLRKEEANTWSPNQRLDEQLERAVYQTHSYGAGLLDENGHTRGPYTRVAAIKDFYNTWYRPQYTSVVVVGSLPPEQSLDAIEENFGHLQNGTPGQLPEQEPDINGPRQITLDSALSRDRLEWVWLTPEIDHPDRPALAALAEILTRYSDTEGRPLTVEMGNRVDRELFRIAITGSRDSGPIMNAVHTFMKEGIPEAELQGIKDRVASQYRSQSLRTRPYFSLAATVGVYAALQKLPALLKFEQQVADLSVQDLQRVARLYLVPQKGIMVLFEGTGAIDEPLPDNAEQLRRVAMEAMQEGNLERSADAYTELLKRNPNRMNKVIYLASRGQVRMQQRDYDAAIDDFQTALDVVEYPDVRKLLEEAEALKAGIKKMPEDEQESTDVSPHGHGNTAEPEAHEHGSQKPVGNNPEQALLDNLQQSRDQLESWRGLAFKSEVTPEFVDPDGVEEKLAGWYDFINSRLVVVKGRSAKFSRGTVLHELHHALQDQHWDLNTLHRQAQEPDQARALRGLIEGEAMLAVEDILDYDFERHMKLPETGPLDRDRFEKIFNYGHGLRYVKALRSNGGWQAVNRVWRQPPKSSAEIYHPNKQQALNHRSVELPLQEGEVLKDSQLGEFELRWLLAETESTRHLAARFGYQLDTDRWRLARHADQRNYEHWDLAFTDNEAAGKFVELAKVAIDAHGWHAEQQGPFIRMVRLAVGEDLQD